MLIMEYLYEQDDFSTSLDDHVCNRYMIILILKYVYEPYHFFTYLDLRMYS
jgi:hypothetical protein